MTIATAVAPPALGVSRQVAGFTMTSGTFDLNGNTLTITGPATFSAGTISNGTIMAQGANTTFSGTVFVASVNAASQFLYLNGSVFNGPVNLAKTGGSDVTCNGGNVFNAEAIISNSGSAYLKLAHNAADVFNAVVTFNNTGSSTLYIGNTAGNTFNDNVYFNNGPTATGIFCSYGVSSGVVHNGHVVVSNTSASGGIYFGGNGGTTVLGESKTLTIGANGFTAGVLKIAGFTQAGSTAQVLVLTDSALFRLGPSTTFNGKVGFSSPGLELNGCNFNDSTELIKTGMVDNSSYGANYFGSATTVTNEGSGFLRLAVSVEDDFAGPVTFVKTGTGAIEPSYGAMSTFAGDVTVNSSTPVVFGAGSGGAVFHTGNVQYIEKTGEAAPVFNKIQVNKPSGKVDLNTDVEVGTALMLTWGIIVSDSENLLVFYDNATCTEVSDTSYVSGPVQKIGDDAFTFPVGGNGHYRPVSISAPSDSADRFTAQYVATDPDASYTSASKDLTIGQVSRCEYWTLDRTNGTSNVVVTLSWNAGSCNTDLPANLKVARWNGTQWKDLGNGGVSGGISSGTVSSVNSISAFGPFTLGSSTANSPLPIELLEFSAEADGDRVNLTWSTASEIDNDYFVIERMNSDGVFETLNIVNGAGNSNSTRYYQTTDHNPTNNLSYYRLTQVDFDGQSEQSEVISVKMENETEMGFELFPNPAHEHAYISLAGTYDLQDRMSVAIHGMNGIEVFSKTITVSEIISQVAITPDSKLPMGTYIVTVVFGEKVMREKLVVQ